MNLSKLFYNNAAVIAFDTETTGLDASEHQIIELAAVRLELQGGRLVETDEIDEFIRLPDGETMPPAIVELTHITDEILQQQGKDRRNVAERFCHLLSDRIQGRKVLIVAHNAQFDLLFIRQLLRGLHPQVRFCFLDSLTVYKDRAVYPHKLEAAIRHYGLEDKVQNSHRAIDDVKALVEVLKAMDEERDDLQTYVNVFGYNPKYGVTGERITGITYHEQTFANFKRPMSMCLPAIVKGESQ